MRVARQLVLASLVALPLAGGCAETTPLPTTPNTLGNDVPLARWSDLSFGVPPNDSIPPESALDIPAQFNIVDRQTSVKDQGERGTCSMFTALALMESI